MTEKEFRKWCKKCNKKIILTDTEWYNIMIKIGKEKGYIEQSALDKAREEYKNAKRMEMVTGTILDMVEYYEQAIKEIQNEEGEIC